MRRAVNYAVDRRALAADGGTFYAHATVAQVYLPPGVPGFRDEHIYPLTPDVATARRLAGRGRRTAVLYCLLQGGSPRAARIIANDLAAIGIDVQVKCMPGDEMYTRILRPGDPWDMVVDGYAGLADPGDYLDSLASRNAVNDSHSSRLGSAVRSTSPSSAWISGPFASGRHAEEVDEARVARRQETTRATFTKQLLPAAVTTVPPVKRANPGAFRRRLASSQYTTS